MEEEIEYPSPITPMEIRAGKILRRSIHSFLQNYHFFTTTPAFLAFPLSASILLISQTLLPVSPLLPTLHSHLSSLLEAAGFPPSQLFTILNLKLSQTITSAILSLPFTLSFLLISKASIIHSLNNYNQEPSLSSFLSTYNPILHTQLFNFILLFSANATCFALLFASFNCLEGFSLSSPNSLLFLTSVGAILYSIVLANALVVCNLALVSSGMDRCGGVYPILKACFLIRGRTATALALALPSNLALAGVEALFHYRVVRAYYDSAQSSISSSMALEGILISYLYAIVIVIDTITSFAFLKSCKTACQIYQEGKYGYRIEIEARM